EFSESKRAPHWRSINPIKEILSQRASWTSRRWKGSEWPNRDLDSENRRGVFRGDFFVRAGARARVRRRLQSGGLGWLSFRAQARNGASRTSDMDGCAAR